MLKKKIGLVFICVIVICHGSFLSCNPIPEDTENPPHEKTLKTEITKSKKKSNKNNHHLCGHMSF